MNADTASTCRRKLDLSETSLEIKPEIERVGQYLDNMRNTQHTERKLLKDTSDKVLNFDNMDYGDVRSMSPLDNDVTGVKRDSSRNYDDECSHTKENKVISENENVDVNKTNRGESNFNNNFDINQNGNENKVRTTSFSVSDILDPNKFVGGCGIQKVWHPWLRDEGVRDYTKSNLEKHSDDTSVTGKLLMYINGNWLQI